METIRKNKGILFFGLLLLILHLLLFLFLFQQDSYRRIRDVTEATLKETLIPKLSLIEYALGRG